MFPLTDMRGNILGFSGRVMDLTTKGGTEMKYVNTPETSIYHKRENLFGLFQAKNEIRDKNEILLVEGEFDAILAHQNGYKQTVAIKGSALTQDHLRLMKRLTNRITFALDMDEAGQEAIKRSIVEAEKYEFQMHVVNLKGGKDPADVFKDAPHQFEEFYKQKQTIYQYLLNYNSQDQDLTTVYGQKNVIEAMLPILDNIYNPILFDHYLKALSQKTQTEEATIKKALQQFKYKNKQKQKSSYTPETKETKNPQETLENYLLALLVQTDKQEQLLETVEKELTKEDFYSPATHKLLEIATTLWHKDKTDFLNKLNKELPSELNDIYNRGFLYQLTQTEVDWHKEIKRAVLKIKKYSLKKQIQKLMTQENETELKNKLKILNRIEKSLSIV